MSKGPVLVVTLTSDNKMSGGLSSASADVEGFGKKVSGFAVGAGAAITTMGINAVPQLLGLGTELFNIGQSAETMAKKSQTVFGDSASGISTWADGINESLGLSDETVVGLAASMGDLLVPLGFSREAAAEMSKESLNAAGALSAWSGGQYDAAEVSDIMTKAMLGETDGLKALGISINAAEIDERALAIAKAEGRDEITATDKALATQQLIMEKSADAQAAWTDGTMDSIKQQNEMKATVSDVKTALGTALLPVVQSVTKFIVNDFIPGVKNLIAVFKEKWPEIQAAVQPVIQWFRDTITDVVTVVTFLWDNFGSNLVRFATDAWNNIKTVIEGVIKVIKGIIDTVMGILTGDWDKAWDGIKGIVEGVWGIIKGIISQALNIIRTVISTAWTIIEGVFRGAWDGIKSVVSTAIGAVVGFVTGIPDRISSTISTLWDGIKTGITTAKDWVGEKIDEVVEFATGLPGRMVGIFSGMWDGIKDAFKSSINWIIDKWNNLSFTLPTVSLDWNGPLPGGKVDVGGWSIDTPNIGRLHKGGIVPGFLGSETLAVLKAGEGVFTPEQTKAIMSRTTDRPKTTTNTTIIQNFPAGTRPTDVRNADRRYSRIQGNL